MGWFVAWKCLVACLLFEESQQPTWPQVRQRRRWTQRSPILRHSSQPDECGCTFLISFTCGHPFIISPSLRTRVSVPIVARCWGNVQGRFFATEAETDLTDCMGKRDME